MPREPSPAGDASSVPRMPASVRVAAIATGVLAALFLTFAGLLAYRFDAAVTNTLGDGETVTRAEAEQFVRTALVVFLLLGVVLALSAWFLPRRQPWARWLGVAVTALLILLSLFAAATTGTITLYLLLVLVLSVAAITGLLARSTGVYIPSLRGR